METIGSTLFKNRLNRYLQQVAKGARFIITDHGKPIAKIVPVADEENESTDEIIAELIAKGIIEQRNSSKNISIAHPSSKKLQLKNRSIVVSDRLLKDRD